MKGRSMAFSLVELMAVIGVMALLAVVAAPALKGLAGSGGRKQAISQIMGAFELARNTAIATGTNAAVAVPDDTFVSSIYSFRSLAVVAWNPTNSTALPTMVGSWINLPEGVAIFPNSVSKLAKANVSVVLPPFQTNVAMLPMIVFQPDGGLFDPAGSGSFPTNGLAIFEGTVTGTTPNRQGTAKVETIVLSRFTGRARGTLMNAP